jgi:hypothetical protein
MRRQRLQCKSIKIDHDDEDTLSTACRPAWIWHFVNKTGGPRAPWLSPLTASRYTQPRSNRCSIRNKELFGDFSWNATGFVLGGVRLRQLLTG